MSTFRKISRVRSFLGTTRWYLSEDCLLASKGNYMVEYRRFYLHDLESITVWPSRLWLLRLILPGALFGALGVSLGVWVDFTTGAIFTSVGLVCVLWELALGPTASSRIRTTGASVDLALVRRTRRAHKVLAKIDAAVRASRASVTGQPSAPVDGPQPAKPSAQASTESTPAPAPIVDLT